ncbi:hypothetical protein QH494_02630 [Sphingomonas sp. AR_OL41]|uniref:hypothetical protein n=1 Tax=Sphingomonas sp. AR_OL41 TaxID=3042729 RepID=UPI002480A27E|nr:hypothetical protein [Sphingomonas sp. AR_OL41]MDH7971065.1 hypothetical protein [Sphingomonas sp. AR_OL41]
MYGQRWGHNLGHDHSPDRLASPSIQNVGQDDRRAESDIEIAPLYLCQQGHGFIIIRLTARGQICGDKLAVIHGLGIDRHSQTITPKSAPKSAKLTPL